MLQAQSKISRPFTGESSCVCQLALGDIGEKRQLGVILCNIAALAYVASSTLKKEIPDNSVLVKTGDLSAVRFESMILHLNRDCVVYSRSPTIYIQPPQFIEDI